MRRTRADDGQSVSAKAPGDQRACTSAWWRRHLPWLPVVLFALLFFVLAPYDNLSFEPRLLLPALNIAFLTGVSVLVAFLAARSYLWGESAAVLLLGCGMLAFGVSSAFAALGILADTPGFTVVLHNVGACLAGALCLASSYLAAPRPTEDSVGQVIRRARAGVILSYAAIIAFLVLVAVADMDGVLPDFVVPGGGFTLVRQVVLGSAVAMFLLSAALFRLLGGSSSSAFISWYTLALLLVALGLANIFTQRAVGSAVSWLGRASQYLGCIYMYVALRSVPGSGRRPWGIPLDQILRETRERHRSLVDLAPDGILVHARGEYLFANQAAARLFGGRSPADVIGRNVLEHVHPDDREDVRARIETVRAGGTAPLRELRIIRLDGSVVHVETTAAPVAFRGEPAIQVAMRDVTERRRAEERLRNSERLYRAIGESIDYGVWVCAPDGRNIYASDSFLRLVGQTQEQCSNFGWGSVLHPDDAERTLAAWKECVRTEGTWDIEHRFKGVDGRWHPILARGVPVRNEAGEIVYWAGINLDISRMKQAEEALREADRRKSEFLATLSHELRNPLAPIRYALELLDREPGRVKPRQVIERQLAHLVRLVDDLLDITRIESSKIHLRRERIEMSPVIRHAVEAASPDIEQARHRLVVPVRAGEGIWVDGDADRLAQVITNLLNNAARYTPPGGTIDLSIVANECEVALTVSDTGVGLRPEDCARVFEMFTQLGEPGRGGLGVGLALVKGIVELHGGTVGAASDGPGRGSRFHVRLPRAAAPMAAAAAAPGVEQPPGALRVLVVDDNHDALEMMRVFLELAGHEVRVAADGHSALAMLAESPADVGLFDIGLPGLDGYELARRVRRDPVAARMYLIAVTGWGQESDRQQAQESGFDAHVTKPADPEEITRLLAAVHPAARTW